MESIKALQVPGVAIPQPAHPMHEAILRFPARPSQVSHIRGRVSKAARSMGFTPDEVDDICIAVGEAATNAIKHGHNPLYPHVEVKIAKYRDAIRISVVDNGPGFDPSTVCPSNARDLKECGRGLLCMRKLMDEVIFHRLDRGMCVEMIKRLSRS